MKAELAAVESIRRGYKGKPLVKNVKKLPPLIGKKKKPSSAKKAEAKKGKPITSGPKATHLQIEGTDELHKLTPADKKAINAYVQKNPGVHIGKQFR